jgi:adenylate cyclase
LSDPEDAGKLIGEEPKRAEKKWVWPVVIVAAIIVASIVWYFYQSTMKPDIEPASLDKMAFPLPDKPSIAVLAFDNLSGDPDQEYFSDGLTEEIITGLSKIPSLFVIARNSSFIYKGKPVKVQQISEELGVRYILEGSVRKEKDRVRITAQLIDAISGYHKWSKRYDRKMGDIFDLQDEIMRDLLNEMRVQLIEGERARVWHQGIRGKKINLEAYEKQMQSRWHFFQMNPEGFAMSKKLAEEAIEIEPNYYAPYVMLAFLNRRNLPLAEKYAQKALELNDSAPMSLITMGQIYLDKRQWEKALAMGEKALALDPNGAEVKNHLGHFLNMSGRHEEAITFFEKAIRLNPYPPSFYYSRLAGTYSNVGRYNEAVEMCRKGLKRNPRDLYARIILAGVYMLQGREKESQAEAKIILKGNPHLSLKQIIAVIPQKNKLVLNNFVEALRKAGLPD